LTFIVSTFVAPNAYQYNLVVAGTVPGYPANGVLQSGMQILKWNGYSFINITNQTALQNNMTNVRLNTKPNDTVTILTNAGLYRFKAVPSSANSSRGVIGVSLNIQTATISQYSKIVYFLFSVFALSMLLNFFVAVVNLLPLPGLDGWRIYTANIKNIKFVKFLGAFIMIMLVVNVLPWVFYLH